MPNPILVTGAVGKPEQTASLWRKIQELVFVPRRRKGKKELVGAGLRIADACQSPCIRQLCVAKQIAEDVCGKHSTFEVISGQELNRAEPVIVVFPLRFNVLLSVHTFSLDESQFFRNRGRNLRDQRLSQCSDLTLIMAAPHYGLHYGSAPATGDFQRLRGRSPLVSPLKSCMGRSFTAMTRFLKSKRVEDCGNSLSMCIADA
jgi:hypothetical protein